MSKLQTFINRKSNVAIQIQTTQAPLKRLLGKNLLEITNTHSYKINTEVNGTTTTINNVIDKPTESQKLKQLYKTLIDK